MKTIQLTIPLPRCRRSTDARDIAQAAAEHLMETFNDDDSLGAIAYAVIPSTFAADLKTLIDYNWKDEERDFRDHPGESKAHIFSVLKRLKQAVS